MMLSMLNQANMEWQRTFKRAGGEPPDLLKRETGYSIISGTTLSAAAATTDVTLSLTDSSTFPSSGAVVCYHQNMPDIIEYTGNSANTLTGVTGIDFAKVSGDAVYKLYVLPTTFHSIRSENQGDGVFVDDVPFTYVADDPIGTQYSIFNNGTYKYLWFPESLTGDCRVTYNKNSTTIDDTSDSVDVPQEHELFLVYRLCQHGFMLRGFPDKALYYERLANEILMQAQRERNIRKGPMVRPLRILVPVDDSLTKRDA